MDRMLLADLETWWFEDLPPAHRNGWREWTTETGGEVCPPDDLRATITPRYVDAFAGDDCHLHPNVLEFLVEHAAEPSE